MSAPFQYLVMHQSTKNHPGVLACQAAHAAGEAIRTAPISQETHVCALVAETSAEIEALAVRLTEAGIHHVVVREPDPPYFGAATALGTEPMEREKVKAFFASFKVLR